MAPSMFAEKNVADIFPTPLFSFKVEDVEGLNAYLHELVEQVRKEEGWDEETLAGKEETLEHLQSSDLLHKRPDFHRFVDLATTATRDALHFLSFEFEEFGITSMWFNVSRPGYSHRSHVHPNNVLSGVYYLQTHESCGDIVFEDPRPQASVLLPNVQDISQFTNHVYSVMPETGQMIMFPSWLAHRVNINRGKSNRISFSFNVMLKGAYGFERAYA